MAVRGLLAMEVPVAAGDPRDARAATPGSRRAPTSPARARPGSGSPPRPPSRRPTPASPAARDLKRIRGRPMRSSISACPSPHQAPRRAAERVPSCSEATSEVTATRWSGSDACRRPEQEGDPERDGERSAREQALEPGVELLGRPEEEVEAHRPFRSPTAARSGLDFRAQSRQRPPIGKCVKLASWPKSLRISSERGRAGRDPRPGACRRRRRQVLAGTERGARVEARAVADVEVADQPDPLERLEVAVDGGDLGPVSGQLAELLGGERLGGVPERFQEQPARGRRSQTGSAHGGRPRHRGPAASTGAAACETGNARQTLLRITVDSQSVTRVAAVRFG